MNKLFIFIFLALLSLTGIHTLIAGEQENSGYTTIAGIIKDIDHENEVITVGRENSETDTGEVTIKIAKGTNYMYVRDARGLLSVENISSLMQDDKVIIKCSGHKTEFRAVEIEKQVSGDKQKNEAGETDTHEY